MERHALLFRLKPGMAAEYKRRHDHIWPELAAVLKQAGFRNYSIWNHGDLLAAYYETESQGAMEDFLAGRPVYGRWRDWMEDIIVKDPVTGKKEDHMELMFLLEGEETP